MSIITLNVHGGGNVKGARPLRVLILILAYYELASPLQSFADRVALTVPVSLFSRYFYDKDSRGKDLPNGPAKSTYGNPQRIGGRLIFDVNLINLSKTPQTGTLEVVAKSVRARVGCSGDGTSRYDQTQLLLCGGVTNTSGRDFKNSTNDKSIPPDASIPAAVTFSLSGEESKELSLVMAFNGVYSDSPTNGCDFHWASLVAAFKIVVNEDRGAILASVTPSSTNFSPPSPDSGFRFCSSGLTYTGAYFAGNYPDSPGVPVQLNGGRPF